MGKIYFIVKIDLKIKSISLLDIHTNMVSWFYKMNSCYFLCLKIVVHLLTKYFLYNTFKIKWFFISLIVMN